MTGRIVFVSEREGHEVWWVRPDGRDLTRVTRSGEDDYPAAQHPKLPQLLLIQATGEHQHDHREQLALAAWRPEQAEGDAGPAITPLGKPAGKLRNPSWFPGGERVVVEAAYDGFRDLYAITVAGEEAGKTERLTNDPKGSFEPAVSPGGQAIAFVSSREDDAEIYLMRLPGKEVDRLTWSKGDDSIPAWAPDGSHIAFVSMRATTPRLHIMQHNGSKPRLLGGEVHAEHIEDRGLAFSPDGTLIAMTRRRKGFAEVVVVRVDSGAIVARSGATKSDEMPAWSPDGRYLVFVSDRSGDTELMLMRRDGSGAVAITQSPGPDWLPRWVP